MKVRIALTRFVALVLCSALILTGLPLSVRAEDEWDNTVSASFAGGDGTEGEPY